MAAVTKTLLQTAYVPSSFGSASYITPSGKTSIIKEIVFCNVTTTPTTVEIDIVPSGNTPGNTIFMNYLIDNKTTWIFPHVLVMQSLYEFWIRSATASAITVRISGVEF